MILALPCRFGEIFELNQNGKNNEYVLTGFCHGIGETVDIVAHLFPTGERGLLFGLEKLTPRYTLKLPDNLYEHQSSANFGLPRKAKGSLGLMELKDGNAVFAFHPSSQPAFPFYGQSPVLEELLRPAMPQPLTEAERLSLPKRALYTIQEHGRRTSFYCRQGGNMVTPFSVLGAVMPVFQQNKDSSFHMDVLSACRSGGTDAIPLAQPALQNILKPINFWHDSRVWEDMLCDLKYRHKQDLSRAPLFQPLPAGQLARKQFNQTTAYQMHITVDLDRNQVSFQFNPRFFSEHCPADFTVGIAEGVDCLRQMADEYPDAEQLSAAMEAPLRRLAGMASHPIRRADLHFDPEILIERGGVNAYIECWDGARERLGLELDSPDDAYNIYGQYDPERGEVALSYIVHYWDGRVGEETEVPLSVQERKLLRSEMEKACVQEHGVSMDEFWQREQTQETGSITLQ